MWSLTEIITDCPLIDVVDIGASIGEEPSYQPLIVAGKARLVGFEPNESECAELNRRYGAPHRFFPMFVGNGKTGTFHETVWTQTGSLFEPNKALNEKFQNLAELTQLVAKHPVQTTRLDDIPDIGDIDFIKIDVQGAELMIFENAPQALAKAVAIQTEVEFVAHYIDQPLFAEVDIELRRSGFQFHTFQSFGSRAFKPLAQSRDRNGGFRQIIWSDAVYVKDWMHFERQSNDKLKKYAVLMHDIFASYDLAHAVIDELDRRQGSRLGERYRERLIGPA